ncbi:hypothetical protein [Polaromonas sp. YR568]|uniref:hypothetical protein n=1 Tax=Polaromonas sp. YR568 TaxID=1855301 RepID=UPI00398BBE5B
MKKFLSVLIRFLLSYSGPALVVFHVFLFKHLFSLGMQAPDVIHTVILNNHGVNRYITEQQDRALDLSLIAAVIMMIAFFVMIILKIRKRR